MLSYRILLLLLCICIICVAKKNNKKKNYNINTNNKNNIGNVIKKVAPSNAIRTIKFEVCEGLTNQRIALIHGLLIAYVTDRVAVLPNIDILNLNNINNSTNLTQISDQYSLSKLYDLNYLIDSMMGHIKIIYLDKYFPTGNIKILKNMIGARSSIIDWKNYNADHLEIGCAFDSIDVSKVAGKFWRIDSALRFNNIIMKLAQNLLLKIGGDTGYTALHFKIEDEWLENCEKWEKGDGTKNSKNRDNCMTYTDVIGNVFKTQRIPTYRPLYIAGGFTREFIESSPLFKDLLSRYTIVTKDTYFSKTELDAHMVDGRESWSAIDAIICEKATLFVGNSVSTFSALIELRRLQHNEPVFHYNAGNIPLANMVPIQHHAVELTANGVDKQNRLKWIFALILSDEKKSRFIDMAKVAIASAVENTSLDPVCLLNIAPSVEGTQWVTDVVAWMEAAGVSVIKHTPEFAPKIKQAFENGKASLKGSSPLYEDYYSMLGTYLRLDIPILGFVDDYVLYTDVDVYFDVDITIDDFEYMPKYLMMGFDSYEQDHTIGNAGVTLFNVQGMRRTYEKLISNIFSDMNIETGLSYGANKGDKGAMNLMYSDIMYPYPKNVVDPELFNWRPYWSIPTDSKTSIIHFHGPKPDDYMNHFLNPEQDIEVYKALFTECDRVRGSCKLWVRKWFDMDTRIKGGYLPHFPR